MALFDGAVWEGKVEAQEYAVKHFARVRWMLGNATMEMTEEEFHCDPGGTANTISAILLHIYGIEDSILARLRGEQTTIWERGGWSEQVGVAITPGHAGGWSEPAAAQIASERVWDYGRAVNAGTDAFVAALPAEELAREITLLGRPAQIADGLILAASHMGLHAGEIAGLRGVGGAKGWPF